MKNRDIDRFKWDECMVKAYNGLIYGYSWYLDEVCENWDALVTEDYSHIMPLPWKSKFGIRYIYQPFFCQQLGVVSTQKMDEEVIQIFLKAIPEHFVKVYTHLNSQINFTIGRSEIKSRKNYRLALASEYPTIRKKYSTNHIRNIKNAKRNEFAAHLNTDYENVLQLYRQYYSQKTRDLSDADYDRFKALCAKMQRRNMLYVIHVTDSDKEIICSAIFFKGPRYLYYMMGASIPEPSGAMHLMMDKIIAEFCGTDLVLDFEGSEIAGIARFFEGFGAGNVPYYTYQKKWMGFL